MLLYMVYGPKMVKGESSLDTTITTNFDWYYLYIAQDAMVPLPLGYVPIIDDEHVDEGAIWLAIISYRLVYMHYMFLLPGSWAFYHNKCITSLHNMCCEKWRVCL